MEKLVQNQAQTVDKRNEVKDVSSSIGFRGKHSAGTISSDSLIHPCEDVRLNHLG